MSIDVRSSQIEESDSVSVRSLPSEGSRVVSNELKEESQSQDKESVLYVDSSSERVIETMVGETRLRVEDGGTKILKKDVSKPDFESLEVFETVLEEEEDEEDEEE